MSDNIINKIRISTTDYLIDAYTKEQTNTLLNAKQDKLTAGTGITISNDNVISATPITYIHTLVCFLYNENDEDEYKEVAFRFFSPRSTPYSTINEIFNYWKDGNYRKFNNVSSFVMDDESEYYFVTDRIAYLFFDEEDINNTSIVVRDLNSNTRTSYDLNDTGSNKHFGCRDEIM